MEWGLCSMEHDARFSALVGKSNMLYVLAALPDQLGVLTRISSFIYPISTCTISSEFHPLCLPSISKRSRTVLNDTSDQVR